MADYMGLGKAQNAIAKRYELIDNAGMGTTPNQIRPGIPVGDLAPIAAQVRAPAPVINYDGYSAHQAYLNSQPQQVQGLGTQVQAPTSPVQAQAPAYVSRRDAVQAKPQQLTMGQLAEQKRNAEYEIQRQAYLKSIGK